MDIIQRIENIDGLRFVGGCSEEQLAQAEKALGIKFPTEYVLYVREYGCIGFGQAEWTGLNVKGRLNVVDATKREKELNKTFPEKCFCSITGVLMERWPLCTKTAEYICYRINLLHLCVTLWVNTWKCVFPTISKIRV